jgi:fused signal recognition particle receptor
MLKWFRRKKADQAASTEAPVFPDEIAQEPAPASGMTADAQEAESIAKATASEPEPAPAPETESEPEPELEAELEPELPGAEPAPKKSLFGRLRERLAGAKSAMVDRVRAAIGLHGKVSEELLEEIEDILIQSDVGVAATRKIVDRMRTEARDTEGSDAVLACFKDAVEAIVSANNRPLALAGPRPRVMLFVGVNGTGKTTTIGKIGRELALAGDKVMMVAADTFRAGAADQLQIWAERVGAAIVRQNDGADPASVVYEALECARREPPDAILIDTAGRLHTKVNLMEELKKIRRVIQKHDPDAPHETILVLDATTGQNALNQLKTFNEATALTGLIMTKLDGTAKGGILVACKDAAALPIFKIGIGERADDLRDFVPRDFVEALFGAPPGAGDANS